MNAFRSTVLSCLRRPHTRSLASRSAFVPPGKKQTTNVAKATKPSSAGGKAQNNGPFRGDAIPHRFVRLVDPETGKLDELQPLKSILSTLDPRSHYLELVSDEPEPIVKIYNRYVEATRAAEAAYRARKVIRQNVHKEVQLSWEAAPADLAHKIGRIREDLVRGARVDLVFARKSKQQRLAPAMMHQRASEAIETLQDVAKEWKERELRLPQGLLIVHLEATEIAEAAADAVVTNSQQEAHGKRFVVNREDTLTDLRNVVRRMRKELAKGNRVELILCAKARTREDKAMDEPPPVDHLHERAKELMKMLEGEAKEWREREYKSESVKLCVFLEKQGAPTRGKVVVLKGPKPKKVKQSDIPDLYQQD